MLSRQIKHNDNKTPFHQGQAHSLEHRAQVGLQPQLILFSVMLLCFQPTLLREEGLLFYTETESVGPIKGAIQGLKPSLWVAVQLNEGIRKSPAPSSFPGFQDADSFFC